MPDSIVAGLNGVVAPEWYSLTVAPRFRRGKAVRHTLDAARSTVPRTRATDAWAQRYRCGRAREIATFRE
ncbi:MAG TPA: hypothetical protein VK939_14505 [Longimicrobiales bacterium]|nr:hypothetical protein [Longimicrobiales bacterium]